MTGGVSYTEKEYDYAVERGVPVLGFVIDGSAGWPEDKRDKGDDGTKVAGLAKFKAKVKSKPVNFWASAADLHGKVAIALQKQMTRKPRTGWAYHGAPWKTGSRSAQCRRASDSTPCSLA